MNTPQEDTLLQRLQELESAVGILQHHVLELESGVAALRGSDLAPAPVPELVEVFCSHCGGGNPPGSPFCGWCRWRMDTVSPESRPVNRVGPAGPAPVLPAPNWPGNAAAPALRNFGFDMMGGSEFWLNKVGVALLLLGVAFLFKYSIDQGWLTPALRVAAGLALGSALLGLGLRSARNRRHFSQVLLGGSIATFYMTGFATYQLFHLAPYAIVFGFMVAVTVLALGLALRQNDSLLSIIGTAGGLATPFLLNTMASNVAGLVTYSCLILAGTSALYFLRGWRWLQFTAYTGFWSILTISYFGAVWPLLIASDLSNMLTGSGPLIVPNTLDQWALQAGVTWGWLAFWAVPLLRSLLRTGSPRPDGPDLSTVDVHRFIVAATVIAVGFSRAIWGLPNTTFGLFVFAGAALYGMVAWGLRPRYAQLAYTQAALALLMFTVGLIMLLKGDTLIFALAAEAFACHLLASRLRDRGLYFSAHFLSGVVAAWLLLRLFHLHSGDLLLLNAQTLTDLAVIAMGFGASWLLRSHGVGKEALVYRVSAYLALLLWTWQELAALPNGNVYVTLAWAGYAFALLIAGVLLQRNRLLLSGALGTLWLVVIKLFLVDMAAVETIWRILLFLGFGGLLLLLSYYFPKLLRSASDATASVTNS